MHQLYHQIDGYCERTSAEFWAEPINALTNLAFLIAALIMWPRARGILGARILCLTLALIGIGSGLFHTYAQVWAALADVLPILAFIVIYIFLANRHFWRWPLWISLAATIAFVPYAAATTTLASQIPFLHISAPYWGVPLLIAAYGIFGAKRWPDTARGLRTGAALLTLSLICRSIDETFCTTLPMGTHFLWHILNAVMLGWMIEVYRRHYTRHMVAPRRDPR